MKSMLTAPAVVTVIAMPASAQDFGSPELIAAAKKEGRLVYYTANFAEVEQEVIKAFNKRFPEIKVEMVRAPGGQLITRVKTEAAAGKLTADVVDLRSRAHERAGRPVPGSRAPERQGLPARLVDFTQAVAAGNASVVGRV